MTSRSRPPRAAALLALLALLHLALPIAAASADCSPTGLGGESCCCVDDGPADVPAGDSCCSEDPEDVPTGPVDEECGCHAVPSPDPLGPVEAPEPPRFERVAQAFAVLLGPLTVAAAPKTARARARARPPGRARAERLLWRVFRL